MARELELLEVIEQETNSATLFDFVILFTRMLKVSVEASLPDWQKLESTYVFLKTVETNTYDLSKSVLVDAAIQHFRPSLIAASLLSCAIELSLKTIFEKRQRLLKSTKSICIEDLAALPVLEQLRKVVEA